MATTASILATGATATTSSDFDVDSTPVSVIAVVTSGALTDSLAVGTLMRRDSAGAYQPVQFWTGEDDCVTVQFRRGAMEVTVVAPGTYRVARHLLTARPNTPLVRFDKATV